MYRQVAAIGKNLRQLPGNGAAGRRNALRYVRRRHRQVQLGIDVDSARLRSGIKDLDRVSSQTTLARARIVCHFEPTSRVAQHVGPCLFDAFQRHRHRRAKFLGE